MAFRTVGNASPGIGGQGEGKLVRKEFLPFVITTLLFAIVQLAHAQQAGKVPRIGVLDPSTASGSAVLWEAFRQELNKLGWIEGKNITIEHRFGEQKPERSPELAAELVRLKVDLIVVAGTPSALAAKSATSNIPIVVTNARSEQVWSTVLHEGNVTGLSGLDRVKHQG